MRVVTCVLRFLARTRRRFLFGEFFLVGGAGGGGLRPIATNVQPAPKAFVAVPSLALGLAQSLAFPYHEATVAGHLRWAAGGRSVPEVQQDLRATIRQSQPPVRQRKVPRLLERLGSPVSSPAREPLSLMIGYAWSCSVPLRWFTPRYSV